MDQPNKPGEKEFETGKDEAWFTKIIELHSTWLANIKRSFDEYQQESLETIKHNRQHFDKLVSDAQSSDNRTREISNQALQNAVETANMVGKQGIRHGDVILNKQLNLEPSEAAGEAVTLRSVTIDDTSLKAIGAAVAAAVVDALGDTKPAE